jgi:hypothetical protein
MSSRGRWKPLAARAVILVVGVVMPGLLIGKIWERQEFVGRVDPASGYRCRFTVSAEWKRRLNTPDPAEPFESEAFTLAHSPIGEWIDNHLLHRSLSDPPTIDLLDGRLNGRAGRGVTEFKPSFLGSDQTDTDHRFKIDGYPSVVLTMRSGWHYETKLIVYVPEVTVVYEISCKTEDEDIARVESEMQEIISSFHIDKVAVSEGGKR